MKYIFGLLFLYAFSLHAQSDLIFSQRVVDCEDKWVVLPQNKDSTYTYGFVYLDNMAGLTFHLGGTFKVVEDKFFAKEQSQNMMSKIRLAPNRTKVAVIPKSRFKEINVEEYPEWLKIYKGKDTASVARLFRLGFTYNQWSEPTKALYYLDRASKVNPKYKGLAYEYAFAYNASKQYEKAIAVLNEEFISNPDDCNLLKELMYAQMNLKQIDKAIETCKKAYQSCSDKNIKSEMLYNITYHYFTQKDKEQFKVWAEEAKKVFTSSNQAMQSIAKMEKELGL